MSRPRKPTELKRMQGTLRKSRQNPNEPTPIRGRPDPPDSLTPEARAVWPGLCDILDGIGVLTRADVFALHGLAEAYADMVEARQLCQDGQRGHGRYSDADRRFLAYLRVFGLTPADRSKVSVVTEPKRNKFADLIEMPSHDD
jgi:phage terminase small subunit